MSLTLVIGKGASSHRVELTSRWDEVELIDASDAVDAALSVGYYQHYANNYPTDYHVIVLGLDGDWRAFIAACERCKPKHSWQHKVTFNFDGLLEAKGEVCGG